MAFKDYPVIEYTANGSTKPVRDITKRIKNNDSTYNDFYYENHILDGAITRPDYISHLLYETYDYDWVILQANNIKNPSEDWMIPTTTFHEYIEKKYPNEMIQLDDNYYSQQQVLTSMEQYQMDYKNKLKKNSLINNLTKLKSQVLSVSTFDTIVYDSITYTITEQKRSELLSFVDDIDIFIVYVNFMDEDWGEKVLVFQSDLENIFSSISTVEIDFFKKELANFFSELVYDVVQYPNNSMLPSTFFIKKETLMGARSGATAIVKDFNYNSSQIIIKNRSGSFIEDEKVYGMDSSSSFVYKSDNLKRESSANYIQKSVNSINDIKKWHFEFYMVSHKLFEIGERAYGEKSGSVIEILNILGTQKVKFKLISGELILDEKLIGMTSSGMAKITAINFGTRFIDIEEIDIEKNQSVVISSVEIVGDQHSVYTESDPIPTSAEVDLFDGYTDDQGLFNSNIIGYSSVFKSDEHEEEIYEVLEIEGLDKLNDYDYDSFMIKVDNALAVLIGWGEINSSSSQSSLLNIAEKTYIEYEQEQNEKKQQIKYLKPEFIQTYIEQYKELLNDGS